MVNNISKRLGIKAYTDYKEMIKSGAVNFITIATPNFLHLEQALYALNNDCDVLIEKPVAFNVKDVDKIIDIADKKIRMHIVYFKLGLIQRFNCWNKYYHQIF